MSEQQAALTLDQVSMVLDQIRPALQMDDADIEPVSFDGRNLHLRFLGSLDGCPSTILIVRMGIERKLREMLPGFGDVVPAP